LALTGAGRRLQSGEAQFDDALAAGIAGASAGSGATGSAHGRLRQAAEAGPDERRSAYAIIAPTERNFRPGPFLAASGGASHGDGEAAREPRRALRRLRSRAEGAGRCMKWR